MMNAHLKAGQYDQVDELWRLGFSNAIELSIPLDINELFSGRQSTTGTTSATGDVPTDKASASGSDKETSGALAPPNSLQQIQGKNKKIIPSRRFILSRLLSTYLKSLAYRGERSKITETVAKFEAAGFALSALNRSTIIEILAESDDFTDVAGAFELFETQFMPNFISWKHMRNQQGLKPPNVPKHVYTLEDRRTPQHSSRVLGKFAKLYWANMDPGFLQPSYLTMVSLAAAVKRLRNRTILHGGDEIQKLYQLAPSTLDALGTMPMYADKIQAVLLRNHAPRRGLRPRPVRYPIRPGGILGRGIHPWKSRPKHSSRDIPGGVLEDKPTGASDAMDEWYSMLGIDVVDQRVTDMPSANDFGESRLFAQKDTTSEDWEKFLSIEDRTDLKFEIVRDRAIRQSRKYRQKELTRTRSSPQKGSRRRP
ncbi:MCM-domain-containing protein [Penicillium chermesinum]|uniref:MCM-domain-containing protein n=1 Tax=Penicillium chermesinum TaxID=63820 RepID=A0A9W9TWY7_9EURO|nr:MCM-domain-containing protein [Penicillium chermesinum]KAJ5246068.1 MCM-domain-containing protein [Penicillium chermesinum]